MTTLVTLPVTVFGTPTVLDLESNLRLCCHGGRWTQLGFVVRPVFQLGSQRAVSNQVEDGS